MTVTPDLIASLVLKEFDRLPAKRKPVVRDNGLREWVPLSGIVAEEGGGKLTCLALATGMKCLPSSKLSQARGNALHDWHAETLAIRAFNRFVLDECHALSSGTKATSGFIRRRECSPQIVDDGQGVDASWHEQPFTWREDVRLHMYCSEAPCGDASMELTMASQVDATPWLIPTIQDENKNKAKDTELPAAPSSATSQPPQDAETHLPGRAYFSQLGIVRRKPARGDAPPTLSKSCSDKLSLHQCTSLLSSLTSLLVAPDHAYVSTLVLPASQYSASGCLRAFSDGSSLSLAEGVKACRMAPLKDIHGRWAGGYRFSPFSVQTTDLEFRFSRRSPPSPDSRHPANAHETKPTKMTPSPLSAAKTSSGQEETTLNGVLQGHKLSNSNSNSNSTTHADVGLRAASFASRRRLWMLAVEIADLLSADRIQYALGCGSPDLADTEEEEGGATRSEIHHAKTYAAVKSSPLLHPRRTVKEDARALALKGWVRNQGDEDFVLGLRYY
ncbi:adenosine deaminase/editase [Xylariaceae sp. FL0594]|nr:adenosine deaminase/editase [Xylariaceae sp. FL0594]